MPISSSGWLVGLLACPGLLSFQGPTPANDAKRLGGKDDYDFARALNERGFDDLAQQILDALARQGGGAGEAGLRSDVIGFDLLQSRAERTQDPVQAAKLLGELVTAKETFVKEHSGTLAADEVLDGLPDLYRRVGELIAAAVNEGEKSPEKDALRQSGRDMFERALNAVQTQIETLRQRKLEQDPLNPDQNLERQLMIATYNLARTRYFQAQLFGPGSDLAPMSLRAALRTLADFSLDYSDQLICYEGFIYEGLCHKGLGEPEKAIESFDAAIALREGYDKQGNIYDMQPEAVDIVSSAVLQKMLIQSETGDHAGAVATANDFFASVPDPFHSLRGLAVLAQQAEAYKALGDDKSVEEVANKLVKEDPHGPAGALGREMLQGGGGGSSLGASDTMKLAEAAAGRGELERAIQLCQEVIGSARGEAQHDLGARAGITLGAVLARKELLHEAVVAYDTAALRFAKGKDAPECLWRAVNGYITLQDEAPAYFKDVVRERMATLVKSYPQSPQASKAALIEGAQLEAEKKFAEAAAIYERVSPDSPAFEDAVYKAGVAWSRMAQAAVKGGNSAEATQAVSQAEAKLKKAREDLEAAAGKTLDIAQQERLRSMAFGARVSLANLYLVEGVNRAADVLPLFERVESDFPNDQAKIATAGNFRLRAMLKLGKTEEATRLLDNLMAKDPEGKGVGSGASTLAQALDTRGAGLRAKDPRSSEAISLWRKAASYYVIGVRGQLEGSEAMRVEDLEVIANRLFALALVFGDVPDDVQSFVDNAGGARPDPNLLEQAVRIYEAVLPLTPSYRTRISLSRALGFLGRWQDAASHYSELFSQQRFADLNSNTIDPDALRAKPEMIFALLEWGVVERELGTRESDNSRKARSASIFATLVNSTTPGTDLWWKAKYYQILALSDRGDYETADVALRQIERDYPDFDGGKLRLEEKFRALQQELKGKVFRNNMVEPPNKKK